MFQEDFNDINISVHAKLSNTLRQKLMHQPPD